MSKVLTQPFEQHTLANGLRVLVIPQSHIHTATAAAFVRVGSRNETEETNGLSHFLEHMLFRGTEQHPSAFEYNLAMEELGGTLLAATHVDYTVYEVTLPPENMHEGIKLLASSFHSPLMRDIELERKILTEEVLESLDDDGHMNQVDDLSRHLIFPGHPLGFTIPGGLENIERFGKEDLKTHLDTFYVARNMVLCIAGRVDPAQVLPIVEQTFGRIVSGASSQVTAPADTAKDSVRFLGAAGHGTQTDVRLSFRTTGENHPDRPALQLLVRMIDDGMSTRLYRHVVEEQGLAYDVFAGLDPYIDCGVLDIGASVEHKKIETVIRAILQVMVDIRDGNIAEAELNKAKRRFLWQLEAMLDDPEGVANWFGTGALFGSFSTIESTTSQLLAVSAADIQRVARNTFRPDNVWVTCVGKSEVFAPDKINTLCQTLLSAPSLDSV